MKKILLVFSIVFVVGLCIISAPKKEDNVSLKNDNNKLLSIYLENNNGEYEAFNGDTFSLNEYTLNNSRSYCTNGGILNYNVSTKNLSTKANGTDRCYVYFDKLIYWTINRSPDGTQGTSCTFPNTNGGSADPSAVRSGIQPYFKTTSQEQRLCVYKNNNEACIPANAWDGNAATTETKLNSLFVGTGFGCFNDTTKVKCSFEMAIGELVDYQCDVQSNGSVSCTVTDDSKGTETITKTCTITGSNVASCETTGGGVTNPDNPGA